MTRPPDSRASTNPWPQWPRVYGVDYGHAEVAAVFGNDPRTYAVSTVEFRGSNGQVKSLVTQDVEVTSSGVKMLPGTGKVWPADLVILSMGFVSPDQTVIKKLGLSVDQRSNIHAGYGDFRTNADGVFAAGDCRRGQSLVVWAINEGRGVADRCHAYLQQKSNEQNDDFMIMKQLS